MLELDTIPTQEAPHPHHHILGNLWVAGFASVVLIVGIGFLLVQKRTATYAPNPEDAPQWAGTINSLLDNGGYQPPQQYAPPPTVSNPSTGASQNIPDYALPKLTQQPQGAAQGSRADNSAFDYKSFLTSIQGSNLNTIRTTLPSQLKTQLKFETMPANLISTTPPSAPKTKTQTDLYEYANGAGAYIQSFEQRNSNQIQVLKDQLEDRTDPRKADAVVELGTSMQRLGKNLLGIQEVPKQIEPAHRDVANAYIEIGESLIRVPAAKSIDDMLRAIDDYNASARTFAQAFAVMVTTLAAYDIGFNSTDPGNVFVFGYKGVSVQQ